MLSVQHYCSCHTQGIGCDRNKIKTLILSPQTLTLNENISIPIESDPEGTEYESRTNQRTR